MTTLKRFFNQSYKLRTLPYRRSMTRQQRPVEPEGQQQTKSIDTFSVEIAAALAYFSRNQQAIARSPARIILRQLITQG